MRRERRHHGVVRTYRILPPPLTPRLVNSLPKLPSNLSQTKDHQEDWPGRVHWVRSNDIASSSNKLLTWRVMTRPGPESNLPNRMVSVDDCEEKGEETEVETGNDEDNYGKKEGCWSHDDNESMSFYDVGMMMMMDHVAADDEEDGWCLV